MDGGMSLFYVSYGLRLWCLAVAFNYCLGLTCMVCCWCLLWCFCTLIVWLLLVLISCDLFVVCLVVLGIVISAPCFPLVVSACIACCCDCAVFGLLFGWCDYR